MKVIPMQKVLDAAKRADATVGHDGAAAHLDVAEVMDAQCICDGSGHREVKFGSRVISVIDCPVCSVG